MLDKWSIIEYNDTHESKTRTRLQHHLPWPHRYHPPLPPLKKSQRPLDKPLSIGYNIHMKENETSYADQAARLDPMFLWHLMGALSVHDGDFLEATALDYMETFHTDALDAQEAKENTDNHLTNPSH